MDISITGQGLEFFWSIMLGLALGITYDVCRILRARIRFVLVTVLLDILFWLVGAVCVFWFAMGFGGGELRIFAMAGIAGGATAYFAVLSRFARAVGFWLFDMLVALLRVAASPILAIVKVFNSAIAGVHSNLDLVEKKNNVRAMPLMMQETRNRQNMYTKGGVLGAKNKKKKAGADSESGGGNLRGVRNISSVYDSDANQREESPNRANEQANSRTKNAEYRSVGNYRF